MEMSNEMIYEILKEFKEDVSNRFDQIAKRLDLMDKRIERIEQQQTEDRKILMNLWENRDNLKLNLTRSLLTVTGILSGVIAIIVSFITGKAIIFSLKN